MSLLELVLVALALSADNFAISVAVGASQSAWHDKVAMLRLPLVFAACSFIAPIAGWFVGSQAARVVHGYGSVAAFAVLAFVGWRTFRSAWHADDGLLDAGSLRNTLLLGIATSGDALTVGFGLGLTHVDILFASGLIAAVTGLMSLAGIFLGTPLARRFGARSKAVAGIVLICIGVHALVAR